MDDLPQLDHLDQFLEPTEGDSQCGENLDSDNSEELTLIELSIEKASEAKEWKALSKDIKKLMENFGIVFIHQRIKMIPMRSTQIE